nr:class I tRNA ligase family protein [Chlorobium phaeobacteroides]
RRYCRTPELIDVWFDSGSMPFAQLHYPFENREVFDTTFPADFIAEGVDQTRGWFYTLHAIGALIFDKPAYKNLVVNGHILDRKGQKMSKSKGNVVDPFETMEKYGADSLRWYLILSSPPWRPKSFNSDEIEEEQRKFFRAFINSYNFFVMYSNVDGFTFSEEPIPVSERSGLDRWIISSLNSLVSGVEQRMEQYDLTGAIRLINDFTVDDLSNWYIRRSRKLFWKGEAGPDKTAAYQSLYQCLETVAKLLAPFTPFIADRIFMNLNAVTGREPVASVHLCDLPSVDAGAIDSPLELRMKKAQIVTSLVRTMRERASIKVRQPLKRIMLAVDDAADRMEYEQVRDFIIDEVNVQKVEYIEDEGSVVSKKAKPDFKSLGPRYGKEVKKLADRIRILTHREIATLETEGSLSLDVEGKIYTITGEDVVVSREDIEGWLVGSDDASGVMVALDTEITPELEMLGLSRELVSRIQALRKDSGLEITDRIEVRVAGSEKVVLAVEKNRDYIRQETLAVVLDVVSPETLSGGREESLNGELCSFVLDKSKS